MLLPLALAVFVDFISRLSAGFVLAWPSAKLTDAPHMFAAVTLKVFLATNSTK